MQVLRERFVVAFHAVGESTSLQAVLLSLVLGASVLLPAQGLGFETCWWHHLYGFNCPSCGLTRSFIAVAHGRFRAAFDFNWMGPPLFTFVCVAWVDRLYRLALRRPLLRYLDTGNPLGVIFWLLLGSWALRVLLAAVD